MVNVNIKTGIPYGVIHGSTVPELLDEIQQKGTNLTYQNWRVRLVIEIRKALTKAIGDFVQPHDRTRRIVESVQEQVADLLLDARLDECYEAEEEEFEYVAPDGTHYKTSHLGGASLIWVLDSLWLVKVRPCSPCVPNAGDLNSPDPQHGMECYCVNPTYFGEDDLRDVRLKVLAETAYQ
jgi:hypothetical protein